MLVNLDAPEVVAAGIDVDIVFFGRGCDGEPSFTSWC
jgi:hypothetical protein